MWCIAHFLSSEMRLSSVTVNDVVMMSDRQLTVPCRFIVAAVLAASLMVLLDAEARVLVVVATPPPRLLPFAESFTFFESDCARSTTSEDAHGILDIAVSDIGVYEVVTEGGAVSKTVS
jgi:hypothetical protein